MNTLLTCIGFLAATALFAIASIAWIVFAAFIAAGVVHGVRALFGR